MHMNALPVCMHVCNTHEGQKRAAELLTLELSTVSHNEGPGNKTQVL